MSEYEIVTATNTSVSSYGNGATATCPSGKRALSGGGIKTIFTAQNGPVITNSFPVGGGTGWRTEMQSLNLAAQSYTITAYAVCVRVS